MGSYCDCEVEVFEGGDLDYKIGSNFSRSKANFV